ncbi:MAG: DUF2853 family protein [Rhodospirillales bacterium]|nr:MAG: DUF2853 family protein [Rhodospirillales bacterium]
MTTDSPMIEKYVEKYAQEIDRYFEKAADTKRLLNLVAMLWPSIKDRDAERVATSDPDEMARVRKFLSDKLGIEADDEMDAGIDAVVEKYGRSNRNKHRAVLYYELFRHFDKETLLDAAAGDEDSPASPGDSGSTKGGPGSGDGHTTEGDKTVPQILFIDAKDAQEAARRRLERELSNLRKRYDEKKNLSKDEVKKLRFLSQILDGTTYPPEDDIVPAGAESAVVMTPGYALDDTYVALREQLGNLFRNDPVPILKDGHFGAGKTVNQMKENDIATAAVWGAITGDGTVAPSVLDAIGYDTSATPPEIKLPKPTSRFSRAVTEAFSDYNSNPKLYKAVLKVMAEAPDVNETGTLVARDWIAVTRTLLGQGVTTETPSLAGRIRAAIDDRLSPSTRKVTSTAEIIIPDLEKNTAQEVLPVNLEAAQAIYFAAMVDEGGLFDTVDKLAELFQIGALPLEKGSAGEYLYDYIRRTPDRISAYERRNTYARVFGVAVGDPNAAGAQFRNFDELWLRFVSAVSDWFRKSQVESLFATNGRYVPSQEQVRKTGLDLAANLSLYCYGGTWFIASELQKNISEYVDLLSSPEVRRLYGARDMWQVIDQVSVLEFGRPINTIRARTMANAGATIIGWLEKNAEKLSHPGSVLISPAELANPPSRSTANSINDPSDYDLVTACEQWLAIEGVGEDIVDVKAAASPSAVTTTTPVRVPPAAQEILGAFGFSHNGGRQAGAPTNGSGRVQ